MCDFFLFHIEIEGKDGWIIGRGGGAKGMLATLSSYWGGGASYAYEISRTPGTESYNLHHQPTTALLGVRKDIY